MKRSRTPVQSARPNSSRGSSLRYKIFFFILGCLSNTVNQILFVGTQHTLGIKVYTFIFPESVRCNIPLARGSQNEDEGPSWESVQRAKQGIAWEDIGAQHQQLDQLRRETVCYMTGLLLLFAE